MAIRRIKQNPAYGLNNPLQSLAPQPIIAQRAPTTSDIAELGTIWIFKPSNQYYVLTSVVSNSASWESAGSANPSFSSLAVTGNATVGGTLGVTGQATFTTLISVDGVNILAGSGVPTASAPQGSLYLRTDGSSSSTRLYVNSNGTTGWVAVTTAS